MVYGTYSTGFRPGGNNRLPQVAAYNADTLTNFEIGWKTSWFDHRLRSNGAVFFEHWNGVQLSVTGNNGITSIVNAANAQVKGIEGDISWLAFDNLTLGASATYVDAKTTNALCPLDPSTEEVTHSCADPTAPVGHAIAGDAESQGEPDRTIQIHHRRLSELRAGNRHSPRHLDQPARPNPQWLTWATCRSSRPSISRQAPA